MWAPVMWAPVIGQPVMSEEHVEPVAHPVGVLAVLQDGAERRRRAVEVELAGADELQRARPVERLGDAGRLEQVGLAQPADGGGDLRRPAARAARAAGACRIAISRATSGWSSQW